MEVSKEVLEKWSVLIEAAKKYWVTSEPTGMTDAEFNAAKQSNKFYIDVKLDGTDPLAYAKIADGLHQIPLASLCRNASATSVVRSAP